jgi:calpain-7
MHHALTTYNQQGPTSGRYRPTRFRRTQPSQLNKSPPPPTSRISRESSPQFQTQLISKSPYSNGLHVLVRFTPRRPNSDLTIIASRDRGIFQRDFTLQAFAPSSTQLSLERVKALLPFSYTVNGHLNSRNAGGHPGNPSHMINPQYKVVIRPDTGKLKGVVRMVVQGDREIPWNVKLVWGNGTRVTE